MSSCIGTGYPGEMPLFTRGLADVGARVIGVGDQPAARAARRRPATPSPPTSRSRRGRTRTARSPPCSTSLRGPQRRPRRIAVGADHAARRPPARGHRRAGPDRRADRAVPGQGAHEGGARGGRHPHPAVRTQHDRRRVPGGRRGDRLSTHHQAHRRRRIARHLPASRTTTELEAALARLGHVPEVSVEEFIDGEEFTYDTVCAARSHRLRQHLLVPPRPLVGKQVERTTPAGDRAPRPRRAGPGRRPGHGRSGHRRPWASRAVSRTWSGTGSRTARSSSARSAPAPPAAG